MYPHNPSIHHSGEMLPMINLFDMMNNQEDTTIYPYFNTAWMGDLATGAVVHDGKNWFVNGGISNCLISRSGPSQSYKTAITLSEICNLLAIYPDAIAIVYDTEESIGKQKAIAGINEFLPFRDTVADRIRIKSSARWTLENIDGEIDELVAILKKHGKKRMIETPVVDPATGKYMKTYVPVIISIDTYSTLPVESSLKIQDKEGFEGKGRTTDLNSGNVKTKFNSKCRLLANQYGFSFFFTAHRGKTGTMDNAGPMSRPKKSLQYGEADMKLKWVGSNLETLARVQTRCSIPTLLKDKSDRFKSEYPYKSDVGNDISRIPMTIERNKNNNSGGTITCVCSQRYNMLQMLTNFDFLREEHKRFGIDEANGKYRLKLMPEKVVTRKNIREQAEGDYAFYRALEITAHMCYIKHHWTALHMFPFSTDYGIEDLAALFERRPELRKKILASRSWWTYADLSNLDRDYGDYLSIFDIMEILAAEMQGETVEVAANDKKEEDPTKALLAA